MFGRYDTRTFDAYKEMQMIRARIENASSSGGSSQVENTEDYTGKMAEIILDYHSDMEEAEREYQQDILDIQKEYARKQELALRASEIGKRRTRASTYELITESDLTQEEQQMLSAKYEDAHNLAMQLAQEGKFTQSQAVLENVANVISEDVDYMTKINEAVTDGNMAEAEKWRYLYSLTKEAQDIELRNILEDGDENINDMNESIAELENSQIQRLDDINLRYADRAQKLLESEPKIAEALGSTNTELSNQAQFIQDLAGYTSPLELGLDGIATSADKALDEIKKLIDYLRKNNLGLAFTGGMANGITEGQDEVIDSAKGVVDATVEGAKTEMEARSPSRRTMREIGMPFVQGIAKGIEKSAKSLNKAVAGVMDKAVKSAQGRLADLPTGIRKTQENIDAFKNITQTNINILEGLRRLLPDNAGSAQGRASYVAAIAKIDQDTEALITARREKLSRDVLLARTEQERQILEAIAQQDIALLQQQANIQKASQQQELTNVADQESINAKLSAIQQNAADKLKALQERMAELAKTNPEEAARRYEIQAQRILEIATLRQELERYLLENNLTADDAFAALLRQQIQQVNALANMELNGTGVGNAAINNTVYNINMDLTGSNLRREDVRQIVRQELSKAVSASRGATS